MSQVESRDEELLRLLNRMIPGLKKAILRDSDKRPDLMNLEIVMLSGSLHIVDELESA